MADLAFQTPAIPPRRVMTALAYAGLGDGLQQLGLRAEVSREGWSLLMRGGRAREDALNALCAGLGIQRGALMSIDETKRVSLEGVSIGGQMMHHLVSRDWSNEADAVAVSTERLVVAPAMVKTDLIALLDKLNAHATFCRAAVLEPPTGASFTLFHLRDDPLRGSSLQAFLNAYSGLTAPVLNGYATEFGTMFLPVAPPRESLNAVAALAHGAPELFGFTDGMIEGWYPDALLVAVARAEDLPSVGHGDAHFYFDIRQAKFFGSSALSDNLRPKNMIAAVPTGNPDDDLKKLRTSLQDPEGQFAFPLRLQTDKSHLLGDGDTPRLNELKAERRVLDIQIRHLTAGLAKQSMMIILPDAAFGAMMRLLREIVADSGAWDGIKYCHVDPQWPGADAFFSQQDLADAARGLHVFHFDPELAERVRLRASFGTDPRIRLFWGDPSWSSIYSNRADIELMVPYRTSLTPVPHAWEPQRADAYLRETVEMWSDSGIKLAADKPHVLLFHRRTDAPADALDLIVFEADGFSPLTGDTITWFNAIQTHMAQSTEGDTRPAQIAEADTTAMGEAIDQAADGIVAGIETAMADLSSFASEAVERFYAHLDTEVAGLMADMKKRAKEISALETAAREMETKYRYAKDKLDRVGNADTAFAKRASKSLASHQKEMDLFIKNLRDREAAFDRAADQTERKIGDMRARLKALHKGWW